MRPENDPFPLLTAQMLIEKEMEYDRWYKEIPFIRFPASWEVKIVPPFRGAVVRFRVRNARGKEISVYLDCYDNLGHYGAPYWEIYPNAEGDISRYPMRDVDGLLDGIKRSFRRRS
jgi:hypothetical protein